MRLCPKHKPGAYAAVMALVAVAALLLLPKPELLNAYTYSDRIYDRNGQLLHLGLSLDDKYRIRVPLREIPPAAREALLLYEDRWFYEHPGVNPVSMLRAVWQMLTGGRRQGASTLTMQVARIVYHIDSSSVSGKLLQIVRALQLEIFYSKDEILEAYFNLAPYGGNIEGIAAAAQVWFNTPVSRLNLPQILTLTVIPQNPVKRSPATPAGLKNAAAAAARLKELWREKHPVSADDDLNLPLSSGRFLPHEAPHAVRRLRETARGKIAATLDENLQKQTEAILSKYVKDNAGRGIFNAAAILVDYKTAEVLAAVGSADFFNEKIDGQVDGTAALRSPGSALKPFIYALALDQGLIHPRTMLKDVPKNYGLYTPENFDRSFYGLVNATQALVYSRNIPAVDLLLRLEENSFYQMLEKAGVKKLKTPGYYGLALALGGAEVSAQDLAALYAMLGNGGKFRPLRWRKDEPQLPETAMLSPEAAFLTLDMLSYNAPVDRRRLPFAKRSGTPYKVYWKTGTSYGYKDAWAAGLFGDYVLVVWVGNFDGTPNPAFTGREAAAPLFFRLVRQIAAGRGIAGDSIRPDGLNLSQADICAATGDLADAYCPQTVKSYFIPGVTRIKLSGVSRRIPIEVASGLRACRHTPPSTRLETYDFWPTDVLQAFARAGINIRKPPAFARDCAQVASLLPGKAPDILFPADNSVFIRRHGQKENRTIPLQAAADSDASVIYWFVNQALAGQTRPGETLEIVPEPGRVEIQAVDDLGRSAVRNITVKLID